jgi:hypothetical protein
VPARVKPADSAIFETRRASQEEPGESTWRVGSGAG